MKKIFLSLISLLFLAMPSFAQQTGAVTITVTDTAAKITTDATCSRIQCFAVIVKENSASPTAVFSVTPTGSSTAINIAAGQSFEFDAGGNRPFGAGQTLGTIAATTSGPFTFVAIESPARTSGANAAQPGGGGGGTPGSPDQSVQINNMGAFGGSAFQYEASGQAVCTAVNTDPCIYAIHTGEGTLMLSPDDVVIVNTDDDNYSSVLSDGALVITNMGDNSNCVYAYDHINCKDGSNRQNFGIGNGQLGLGANGLVGGAITLNDATAGSAHIGADGNNLSFTSDAPYLLPIEIGDFFGASGLFIGSPSGAFVATLGDGMGNADIEVGNSSGNCTMVINSTSPEARCTVGVAVASLNMDNTDPRIELTDHLGVSAFMTGTNGDLSQDTGTFLIPSIESMSGQRFVCVTTTGALVSSASACIGT